VLLWQEEDCPHGSVAERAGAVLHGLLAFDCPLEPTAETIAETIGFHEKSQFPFEIMQTKSRDNGGALLFVDMECSSHAEIDRYCRFSH